MAEPAQVDSSIAREVARSPAPPALSEAPTGPHQSVQPQVTVSRPVENFADKVWRFLRNALTGGLATAVQYMVYLPIVTIWGDDYNNMGRQIGLVVGAVFQFLGCRYFVFRAAEGGLRKQVMGFILAEAVTLAMNMLMLQIAHWVLPRDIDNNRFVPLVTTNLVFIFFSYPIWHWVFKAPHTAQGVADSVARETQRMQKQADVAK